MQYWIIKGRYAVKNVIRECIDCCRWSRKGCAQIMGDLPTSRTSPSRPFEVAGIDYAGPKCRGNVTLKDYIAGFVCFSTHAVHLEAVEDYSSLAFISAFHRFTARRGHCAVLNSAQGTSFVGADTELNALLKAVQDNSSQVFCDLAADATHWHSYHQGRHTLAGSQKPPLSPLNSIWCRLSAIKY